jgi:transketolase
MAALMKLRQIMVYTHDSIGLGEDGPTHQPVEHAASLRLIPNLDVWRPADATETAIAWVKGLENASGPTALLLSRQNLPPVANKTAATDIARGGYVVSPATNVKAVLIATGSEVKLALDAQAALAEAGIAVNVVSMPSTTTFDKQDKAWRDQVLPAGLPRVAIEAGHPDGWYKYVGLDGAVVGLARFGESAPAALLFKEFGFTVENVVNTVRGVLSK